MTPRLFKRDPHPYPHLMVDGGCSCTCPLCVDGKPFQRCICPRCDQTCPGIGRLGGQDEIARERAAGLHTIGTPARRWFRR